MCPTNSTADWMIYGANGYTGRLIAGEAVRRGMRPVLAGRRRDAVITLARELDCPAAVFDLERPADVARRLAHCALVVNCAGPFSATAVPMMEACLATGTHYLDITGEIDCIEAAADRHQRAVEAGIALIPGVGFDVVPTDCLAAMLVARRPSATHLQLAFHATGPLSPGTTKTMLEALPRGGRARSEGRIIRVPVAWKVTRIPFRDRPRWSMTIPWGDVASAYHTTGIPNIEVFTTLPRRQIVWVRRLRWLLPVLGFGPVQRSLRRRIGRRVHGPTAAERDRSRVSIWGRVADGTAVEATMETPGGYPLTVQTALAAVGRLRRGTVRSGFATPSRAFGAGFILEIPGVEVHGDVAPAHPGRSAGTTGAHSVLPPEC